MLDDQFSAAFTQEDLSSLPTPEQIFDPELCPLLMTVEIAPKIVGDKINVLKPCASEPDKIIPRILRELSAQLSLPISIIFNKSLIECLVPNDW